MGLQPIYERIASIVQLGDCHLAVSTLLDVCRHFVAQLIVQPSKQIVAELFP
jgi:hypothetical protein